MNPQDITSLAELIAWITTKITTPKTPPLRGDELSTILRKIIEFRNEGIVDNNIPTAGVISSVSGPLVINWDTALVPSDEEGRTYLEKHGPLEKVSIQTAMPDPANAGEVTVFPNWRFDEATKNILTIDNQGQKLYYVIGFGADGSSGGGGSMTGAEIRAALGITTLSGSNTGDQDLSNLVVKETGKGLSENDYTDAEKTKLANLNDYFVGTYASYGALVAAHPTGLPGEYAVVDTALENARQYIWDDTNDDWVQGNTGAVTSVNGQSGPVSLDTDDIGEGSTNKYWTLARTVGAVLTGYVVGSGYAVVAATDTIMQAIQKMAGSLAYFNMVVTFKADISAAVGVSTALTFESDSVQGTITTPLTGNITGSAVNALLGVTVLVIHNSGTEPTFDSKFKKLSGSGDYVLSSVNYIYCQYIDATHIIYSINQSA